MAFKIDNVELVDGRQIANHPTNKNVNLVALFGKGWGGKLRVPGRLNRGRKSSSFRADWILARLNTEKKLVEFAALEVQTMDTIGSYRAEHEAILNSVEHVGTSAGPNWENGNKRILPQAIRAALGEN